MTEELAGPHTAPAVAARLARFPAGPEFSSER